MLDLLSKSRNYRQEIVYKLEISFGHNLTEKIVCNTQDLNNRHLNNRKGKGKIIDLFCLSDARILQFYLMKFKFAKGNDPHSLNN